MTLQANAEDAGKRLDWFVREKLPEYSRSRIQEWIRAGQVLVEGSVARPSYMLACGERVDVTPIAPAPLHATPEEIPLSVLFEDDDLVAIDKPAGMVVHAGAGVNSGTVVNAILHRFQSLSGIGGQTRPGIVHRLDRFTSGVLLIAKNDAAHRNLAEQFAARQVKKIYLALVHGRIAEDRGRVEKPISRDPKRRERMTARLASGRAAWSEFTVLRRYRQFTYVQVSIGTGRTHQIRVHLSSIGHVVAGDVLYGAPKSELGRFFLHAHTIAFRHPLTGAELEIAAPLAPELESWKALLDLDP